MIWYIVAAAGLLFMVYEILRTELYIYTHHKRSRNEKDMRVLEHSKRLDREIRDVDGL